MALSVSSSTEPAGTLDWVDFYIKNRNDNGPIQALFAEDLQTMAQKTVGHLNDSNALTEYIVGSAFGNMLIVPGTRGIMQTIHHGFGSATSTGFSLNFAHGNLEGCTIFKTLPRLETVAQLGNETGRRSGTNLDSPSLASMIAVTTEEEFVNLPAEANGILRKRPNHALITPQLFFLINGARTASAKEMALKIINVLAVTDGDEESEVRESKATEQGWAESLLAFLWASEKGFLNPIHLEDVPESGIMNHTIKGIKEKLGSGKIPAMVSPGGAAGTEGANFHQIELMAASSQNLVSILNRMQDGNDLERSKKEADKSIDPEGNGTDPTRPLYAPLYGEHGIASSNVSVYVEPDQLQVTSESNQPHPIGSPRLGRNFFGRGNAQAPLQRIPIPRDKQSKFGWLLRIYVSPPHC